MQCRSLFFCKTLLSIYKQSINTEKRSLSSEQQIVETVLHLNTWAWPVVYALDRDVLWKNDNLSIFVSSFIIHSGKDRYRNGPKRQQMHFSLKVFTFLYLLVWTPGNERNYSFLSLSLSLCFPFGKKYILKFTYLKSASLHALPQCITRPQRVIRPCTLTQSKCNQQSA